MTLSCGVILCEISLTETLVIVGRRIDYVRDSIYGRENLKNLFTSGGLGGILYAGQAGG
jgi:hypothetical protein